ncbi:MAG TPA: carboxypeptidase-like regulatory domain-containing protein [Acidobacteriaceae bacterium]|nr:carboxypeptidase-like regulatory domain-containing protein [Acidobacteriaceae bacterium]
MDPTKALLPGSHLVLTDIETGVTREGATLSSGTFTFTALPPASYRLQVEHTGFSSVSYDKIVVQAGVATPVNVILNIGTTTQEVNVSGVSVPVIEVSSNTLSTSINIDEVNNLPVANRSLIGLQALSPGFASTTGNGAGTFNGTPQAAYQASVDGINATSSRFKAGSGSGDAVTLRPENIQEFTVQSGELPPSQGGGQSSVQTLFVTRRGTNKFHGNLFENHQDETLNAFP